jgi:hypothetical protein
VLRKGARRARRKAPAAVVAPPPLPAQPCLSVSSRLLTPTAYTLHD